jgi:DNA-binding winged helix-turn-helix (wHTH) protein
MLPSVSYLFGPFVLDPSARVLRRDGRLLVITPKIFELLVFLIQRRGQLVTKDELRSALWPDTVVEEANLAQSMSVLRRTLGDTPREHRYIATIPGRGYSFVGPVTEGEEATAAVAPRPDRTVASRITWLVIAFSLAGAAGYVVFKKPSTAAFYSSAPLTTYVGSELCPTFSPDGDRVAFAWDGEHQDNFDLYEKQLGVAPPRRLTSDPEPDISPSWSPDGPTLPICISWGTTERSC